MASRRHPDETWQDFASRHSGHPFLELDPLYALSERAIDAIHKEAPNFFTPEQERFERALARSACHGFFLGRPIGGLISPPTNEEVPGIPRREQIRSPHSAASIERLPDEDLLAHSARGSPYASEHYQLLLGNHGIACSRSEVGQCWDNAPAESFFASLKKELVHAEDYQTRAEAAASSFAYIEVFSNRQRRHSTLGYVSPAESEVAVKTNDQPCACSV